MNIHSPFDPDAMRAGHLADHIEQCSRLLREYEQLLQTEEDPARRSRYRSQIERLRESLAQFRNEYDDLQSRSRLEPAALTELAAKIGVLESGLAETLADAEALRALLENRFADEQRNLARTLLAGLDQKQLALTRQLLNALDAGELDPEATSAAVVAATQGACETLDRVPPAEATVAAAISSTAKVLEDPKVETKSKFKLTVPLIPLLLAYETEVGFSGAANLKAAWQGLISKVRPRT